MKSRFEPTRRALIFWCLFIGIGAVGGACCMFIRPDGSIMGMETLLPYFGVLPFADILFQNYLFSGFALLVVNGITNLLAAWLLFRRKKLGVALGGIFGVTLMLWITIQFCIFPLNFLDIAYFTFGLAQALTGLAAWIFFKQEHLQFDPNSYKNIGTNASHLVVYCSRMGYTQKLAYQTANKTGAQLYRIVPTEKVSGTMGYWWCGRFALHRWAMPIEKCPLDLSRYEHVTICTPIWAFSIAAPVRTFCKDSAGKIKAADYVLLHFSSPKYLKAAHEMDTLLGLSSSPVQSVRCRCGRFKTLTK